MNIANPNTGSSPGHRDSRPLAKGQAISNTQRLGISRAGKAEPRKYAHCISIIPAHFNSLEKFADLSHPNNALLSARLVSHSEETQFRITRALGEMTNYR